MSRCVFYAERNSHSFLTKLTELALTGLVMIVCKGAQKKAGRQWPLREKFFQGAYERRIIDR
ncbi:hypothetical protein CSB45_01965 [candidate division KSB3 bacterium]|uniref:Uncharacterized protein n=1 Tax=candidate division KSB3 bacterium TaxID=2044937 RepID=A0A2G6EAK1_9BACT|nr:MAG: hypothetical protein CSB45_01965 [candidate division KSB3 bacterium]PIE30849.1 MAG: hypothetical protein CSA57_00575 [candidate division KSB3 bacterium]